MRLKRGAGAGDVAPSTSTSVPRSLRCGSSAASDMLGQLPLQPETLQEPLPELRLDAAHPHVLTVASGVDVVERRAAVEVVRARFPGRRPLAARLQTPVRLTPSTIAASTTWPRPQHRGERARTEPGELHDPQIPQRRGPGRPTLLNF